MLVHVGRANPIFLNHQLSNDVRAILTLVIMVDLFLRRTRVCYTEPRIVNGLSLVTLTCAVPLSAPSAGQRVYSARRARGPLTNRT